MTGQEFTKRVADPADTAKAGTQPKTLNGQYRIALDRANDRITDGWGKGGVYDLIRQTYAKGEVVTLPEDK